MYYPKSLYSYEYVFNLSSQKTPVKPLFPDFELFLPCKTAKAVQRSPSAFPEENGSGNHLKKYDKSK